MKKSRLILLLPVFNGGDLFSRCLRSISPCIDIFDKICISINGVNSEDDYLKSINFTCPKDKLLILQTGKYLSPVGHFIWITQRLKYSFLGDDRILFLAHDDELIENSLRHWNLIRNNFHPRTAWIGDYDFVSDNLESISMKLGNRSAVPPSAYKGPLTLIDWLEHNSNDPRKYVNTNMSGISVPFKTLTRIACFWELSKGSIGARFEYLLVSDRKIEGIMAVEDPIVRVHLHLSQAGRNVQLMDYIKDELRYSTWLIINSKSIKVFFWILLSPWGVKSFMKNSLKLTYLKIKLLFHSAKN